MYLTCQIRTVLNISRSPISAFIPRTAETSLEYHKTLSRFDFERLPFLFGYLKTDNCHVRLWIARSASDRPEGTGRVLAVVVVIQCNR